jgi:hypothetical protein
MGETMIRYEIINRDNEDMESFKLAAKNDRSARKEAGRVAKENGIAEYAIRFFRVTDGCFGFIDK